MRAAEYCPPDSTTRNKNCEGTPGGAHFMIINKFLHIHDPKHVYDPSFLASIKKEYYIRRAEFLCRHRTQYQGMLGYLHSSPHLQPYEALGVRSKSPKLLNKVIGLTN